MLMRLLLLLCLGLGMIGCSGPKPILYPNDHYKQVGPDAAERDIADCRQLAKEAGAKPEHGKAASAAGNVAGGAAVGAAGGAVGGAVVGAAGTGSAIGAASGATMALLRWLFTGPKPSSAHVNFVNRCLQERGYEPMGWE
jgi:hypothetical protein